ncbi:SDR family NAD(P)-dependent oxidoreductase [Stieleria sp. ICT_E10.1]|uniref:SDR family NAD(P)-dependent oxidoreductase n=1 Tax=Stieleria sedimenti TaxID=2976331 RepID=UPI00218017B4|nr:SDR family NAD(P)-dependent oxidoreductase [Stieleria sedimenti]MCS7469422.1 SDR family NAD(P)-dependent oxidoreductase [Stieleria sedimenti]
MTDSTPTPSESRVLITGGTGSFGKTMVKHLLSQGYGEIRIFSRDEWKQEEMRVAMNEPRLKFYVGDVRDEHSVTRAMNNVDLVFHAAALKQVPSCEFFPMQAVQTNVMGSYNVVDAAVRCGVKCIVALGTDKAVYPINAMGMTKALMEKTVQSFARNGEDHNTRVCSVRYGNVMYSRGSVIPLFVGQIKSGKPVTITDPQMTRFLLPLSESVRLVEFAFNHAESGDVFIKKAPASTVQDLATALFELFEQKPNIKVIGIRHGEKIHETLATQAEIARSEDMGDFLRIHMDDRDLNYGKFFVEGETDISANDDYNSSNTQILNVAEVKELLLTLPEIRTELGL